MYGNGKTKIAFVLSLVVFAVAINMLQLSAKYSNVIGLAILLFFAGISIFTFEKDKSTYQLIKTGSRRYVVSLTASLLFCVFLFFEDFFATENLVVNIGLPLFAALIIYQNVSVYYLPDPDHMYELNRRRALFATYNLKEIRFYDSKIRFVSYDQTDVLTISKSQVKSPSWMKVKQKLEEAYPDKIFIQKA
jgi:hypothetical protein